MIVKESFVDVYNTLGSELIDEERYCTEVVMDFSSLYIQDQHQQSSNRILSELSILKGSLEVRCHMTRHIRNLLGEASPRAKFLSGVIMIIIYSWFLRTSNIIIDCCILGTIVVYGMMNERGLKEFKIKK